VLLGALCLVLFLAEGAMLDWSAVLLRSERGVALSDAGLGYAAFSIAMAAGRLLGDRITAALGPVRIVRYGSVVAAAGFALAGALPWAASSLVGFVLVGVGASNIVPVLFSAAGRIRGTAPGVAIATVTTFGYTGLLAGPALIGAVAHALGLPLALGGIAALLAAVSAGASSLRRDRSARCPPPSRASWSSTSAACWSTGTRATCTAGCSPAIRPAWSGSSPRSAPPSGTSARTPAGRGRRRWPSWSAGTPRRPT
jgi:MFS family permease